MPQGLECYDASGNLTFSITDRLARVLGQVSTGAVNGSLTDAGFAEGSPFYAFFRTGGGTYISPQIYVTGNTLTWEYLNDASTDGSYRAAGYIIYGIY